jgi:hypothetical protein|tara:strand:- start:782 stop:949 length:168 start_codon:yes stop_codon:yes gene_type:complete
MKKQPLSIVIIFLFMVTLIVHDWAKIHSGGGVHFTPEGYEVIEPFREEVIKKVLK